MFNRVKASWALNSKSAAKIAGFIALLALALLRVSTVTTVNAQSANDPGVRGGPPGAGNWFTTLTKEQQGEFQIIFSNFVEQNESPPEKGEMSSEQAWAQDLILIPATAVITFRPSAGRVRRSISCSRSIS